MNDSLTIAGREFQSRLILGTGGFTNHEVLASALEASGTRDVHRRAAPPRTRPPAGSILDVLDGAGVAGAPEHGRLLHGAGRDHHRPARARGVPDRLDQARGDRRRPHAAAGRRRARERRRGPGRRRLHRAALHDRRPDPGPPARGRGLRRGDAARLADRQRHGHPQPVQHLDHDRARGRAGDPRRRRGHRLGRHAGDRAGLRRGAVRERDLPRPRPVRRWRGRSGWRSRRAGWPAGRPDPPPPLRRGVHAATRGSRCSTPAAQ